MPKILLSELVAKVETGDLSEKDFSRFFAVDKKRSSAFAPRMKLKRGAVAVGRLDATADVLGSALALEANLAIKAAAVPAAADAVVLAEGDSWFDLPVIWPKTMVDHLNENDFPVREIAVWGDTMENMVSGGEYIEPIKTRKFKVFMFSGGGNDIVGETMLTHLRQRQSGDNDPANAPHYIADSFIEALDRVLKLYGDLVRSVQKLSPNTVTVCHGYAYAIPHRGGPWVGSFLEHHGFDPVDHAALSRAIVRSMIDLFNDRLAAFAKANKAVVHVDLRKTVKANEWFDEIHPRSAATARMATEMAKRIKPLLA